ncbi:hypothetical protein Tco_1311903 [Tanacetum coccineum]
MASSSSKSSSTKGDVLEGGGVSSNVTLSDSSIFLVKLGKVVFGVQNEALASKQSKIVKREDEGDEDDNDEEEEEHLALADSAVVVPTVELVSPPEGTKPVIPPPSTDITTTGARIIIRL